MKTWSKYIILIIIVFAIFFCKGEVISSKNNQNDLIEQLSDETECLSADVADFWSPRMYVLINTQLVHKNSYRRDNSQRYFSYAIKTNKITNLYSIEYTLDKITHKNSILSEPSYRLIKLGKLII